MYSEPRLLTFYVSSSVCLFPSCWALGSKWLSRGHPTPHNSWLKLTNCLHKNFMDEPTQHYLGRSISHVASTRSFPLFTFLLVWKMKHCILLIVCFLHGIWASFPMVTSHAFFSKTHFWAVRVLAAWRTTLGHLFQVSNPCAPANHRAWDKAGIHLCLLKGIESLCGQHGSKFFPGVGNPPALEIIQNKWLSVSGINIWTSQSHSGLDCQAEHPVEGPVSRLTGYRALCGLDPLCCLASLPLRTHLL